MEPFSQVLMAGGASNSLGRGGEVVDAVLADPGRLDELTTSEQPSIQWHVAQLMGEVDLDDEQRARSVRWLTDREKLSGVSDRT